MSIMPATSFIQCRVNTEFKARVRELASRRNMSESELVKHLLSVALDETGVAPPSRAVPAGPRGSLHVRLYPDDRLLLSARASIRGMPSASYVSVLLRSHLRNLAPLPKAELSALKACLAELGLLTRTLHRILGGGATNAGQVREDFRAMLKVAQGVRDHAKALLKQNLESWRTGYEV
jgi:hypothetical protein